MQMESLLQLVSSGGFSALEREWMAIVEREETTAEELGELKPVIDALVEKRQVESAESLSWAAIDAVTNRQSPEEALRFAKPFLLTLNRSEELRKQITELYLTVFGDREGLEALIESSGIAGGRPPRRAIRTLDVCLAVEPGSFVVSRHEDGAARVEAVDSSNWEVTVETGSGTETLAPVAFADTYGPCDADDHRVLVHFDPERLSRMVEKDPGAIITNILRLHDGVMDSDGLQRVMSPGIVAPENWAKWWTKARAAIRRSTHIKLEGRSPYTLKSVSDASGYHREFAERFSRLESSSNRLGALNNYLADCKARKSPPDGKTLDSLGDSVSARAGRLEAAGADIAFAERLVEWQIGAAMEDASADGAALALLSGSQKPASLLQSCESARLWSLGCDCLEKALPDRWTEVLAESFPWAPAAACEDFAGRLAKAGFAADRIEPVVAKIVSNAVVCYAALCWLWDKGPSHEGWRSVAPKTILTRLLWVLSDVRLNESIPAVTIQSIRSSVRSALSARKFERFSECLTQIEPGMAVALRTQVQRLDNIGRKVQEDLLTRITEKFPHRSSKPETPVWAQEDVTLATEEGISKRSADINELVNVKMKENAIAIGTAAEKGDLSENSEYKFALEERDLLRARLKMMQGQLSEARQIEPEDVPTDHVGVGSRVTFRHVATGKTADITFLGPLESNVDKGIYNYKAPLAQDIMGLHVGDEIELPMLEPPGAYVIDGFRPWR